MEFRGSPVFLDRSLEGALHRLEVQQPLPRFGRALDVGGPLGKAGLDEKAI